MRSVLPFTVSTIAEKSGLPATAAMSGVSRSLTNAVMTAVTERQTRLEAINGEIERQVAQRTAELVEENAGRQRSEEALRESELRFAIDEFTDKPR